MGEVVEGIRRCLIAVLLLLFPSVALGQAVSTSEVTLWGQGMKASLATGTQGHWSTRPTVDYFGAWSGTELELLDKNSNAKKGLSVFVRIHIMSCDRARPSTGETPSSTTSIDKFKIAYFGSGPGGKTRAVACGPIRLANRRVYGLVTAELEPGLAGGAPLFESLLPALRTAFEKQGRTPAVLITDYPGKVPDNFVHSLRLLDGTSKVLRDAKQVWSTTQSDRGKVKYRQVAPYVGTTDAEFELVEGQDCAARLKSKPRSRLAPAAAPLPRGYSAAAFPSRGSTTWLCRRVGKYRLLVTRFDSPMEHERGLAHAAPFLAAMGDALAGPAKAPPKDTKVALKAPANHEAYADRIRRMSNIQARASNSRKRLENARSNRNARQRVLAKELKERNRRAKQQAKQVGEIPLDSLVFADLGWRTWMSSPSRVPEPVVDLASPDAPSGFAALGQAWSGQVGGILGNIYGAASFDAYTGNVRDGASPRVYQVTAGYGRAAKVWSEGGPMQHKSYQHEWLDQNGEPCPEIDKSMSVAEARDANRGVKCGSKVRVTETTTTFNVQPGWGKQWYGIYGGYRYVDDMLGGKSSDPTRPLVSGGGPMVGGAFLGEFGAVAFEFSQELAYYVHGWDDHGHFGYNGRVGFGSPFALMDLRWRLDSGVGKEFMVGLRLRLDLF